jgi:hypothetical protein
LQAYCWEKMETAPCSADVAGCDGHGALSVHAEVLEAEVQNADVM